MGYFDEQVFTGVDFGKEEWQKGEYVDSKFVNCRMSSLDLSGDTFDNCEFIGCDLSLCKIDHTAFKEVDFKDCKLMGLHFSDCNAFLLTFRFTDCILDFSSFFKLKIKQSKFTNCKMEKVDFVEADLTGSTFNNCDLAQAVFNRTILEKCDFRSSYNLALDPEDNRIKAAKFSTEGALGLLEKYNITIER
ncbi:pentapeptide repeat-containing protein [Reichenbachiella agarivorans]|uniref:Pentapeptide repeat-containing protein n=1 Tax=Reichenbachiella agarivorans TaxID=2979464 RepID=A0ABY6CS90_9BACT|nr:pentapeptide repeat-containing protein [Reichenbachiella agarivorans]UXP33384.1 pentapeptide repeat-containing protein [Reichenbachiella agarivorans]